MIIAIQRGMASKVGAGIKRGDAENGGGSRRALSMKRALFPIERFLEAAAAKGGG